MKRNRPNLVINQIILEYDMRAAGASLLLEYSDASKKYRREAKKIAAIEDKKDKAIALGLLLRKDKELNKIINAGFKKATTRFCSMNRIPSENILDIKKDAIFLIDSIPDFTRIGKHIEFRLKSKYSSFFKIFNVELYYSSWKDTLEVKNLGTLSELHEQYFLMLLKDIIKRIEKYPSYENVNYFQGIRKKYIERKFPMEYYREFSLHSKYRLLNSLSGKTTYMAEDIDSSLLKHVDIGYNLSFLQELFSIYYSKF